MSDRFEAVRADEVDPNVQAFIERQFGIASDSPKSATLRQNERIKLLASALDRLSTAFCTAGIATPLAGRLFGTVSNSLPSWFYGATFGVFAGLAVLLHLLARRVLGGLR